MVVLDQLNEVANHRSATISIIVNKEVIKS